MNIMTLSLAILLLACVATASPAAEDVGKASDFSQYNDQAYRVLEQMSLEEKVGQMTQAELGSLQDLSDIRTLAIGSVLSGGDSDPAAGNSLVNWRDTYDTCQKQAIASRLGVPLLYGVDAVHGHNNVAGAVVFPHNIGLGCTNDSQLVEDIGRLTALDVRATGMQWTFAPCVAVPRDDRWGRTYEGFGEHPDLVSRLGAAAIRGLQGANLSDPRRVLACAKHFAGDGGTVPQEIPATEDSARRWKLDQGNTQIDRQLFHALHIHPYIEAIDAGVGSVMVSYSSWNGVKCTGHRELLTEILKNALHFEGFVISDYAAIDQVNADYKTAVATCINAGIDMAMVPERHREFHQTLVELVDEGKVPMERINDAVLRILRVKAAMGLLDSDRPQLADKALANEFSSEQHRQVARRAVRKSVVLLKNNNHTLPLSRHAKRIAVVGPAADDLGYQCGGWTITWQGKANNSSLEGTTILQAMRDTAGSASIHYSPDGSGIGQADAVVVVVGEPPYAEGRGDDFELELPEGDRQLIDTANQANVPSVLVVLSGRPLAMTPYIERADSVVAAWLPGTEGGGVGDVLFGIYPPTGKLSFSWPRSADQHPINVGDSNYNPLFPVGYGLSY